MIIKVIRLIFYKIKSVFLYIKSNRLLKKYIHKDQIDNTVFLLSLEGIGGQTYSYAFLKELRKKHANKKIALFAIKDRRVDMIKYYSDYVDKIILYSKKECDVLTDGLAVFGRMLARSYSKKTVFYFGSPWGFHASGEFSKAKYSIVDIFKDIVFELEDDLDLLPPNVPVIDRDQLIEKYEIIPNKTIIINPYSASLKNDKIYLFEQMAEHYISKGYKVFSNLAPGQEAVKNTTPLSCSIDELYNLAPICGYFIGTRSGIMDFLVSSKTTIIAHHFGWGCNRLYPMKGWESLNKNAYDFNGKDEDFLPFVQNIIGE